MFSPLCSFLVISIPITCVVISFSRLPALRDGCDLTSKVFEMSYILLCSLPYKELIVDFQKCDNLSVYPAPIDDFETNDLNLPHPQSEPDELESYSDLNTFMSGMIKDENEEKEKEKGTSNHGFNLFASDKIGLRRNVPDTRNNVCKGKKYREVLPTASIVMCFYNEAWSTLLRSIHSILSGTPEKLIQEIILVDDHSSFDHLKTPLDEYIKANFSKVKIIHSPVRLGLIRARMKGAKQASGEVLIFLDSHIEVGRDWLPPLLNRIAEDRKTVVVPVVDSIEGTSMVYKKAKLVRGGFTWSLLHNWEQLPLDVLAEVEVTSDPFISPTMPGGLFAMERNYFYEIGEYDSGMDIWGGENMEISFRIWQCGGRLEIVPCSRIGHVFRQFRPYGSPNGQDTAARNAARVAYVWLDEYKRHFFELRPDAKTMDYGDVSDRIQLRKRLGCKSFQWFLETIHPEQVVPGEAPKVPGAFFRREPPPPSNVIAKGSLKHHGSGLCIASEKTPKKGTELLLAECHSVENVAEIFILSDDYSFRLLKSNLCIEVQRKKKGNNILLMKCAPGGFQTWVQIEQDGHQVFYNPPSGKCLAAKTSHKGVELSTDFCPRPSTHGFMFQ